MYAHCGVCQTYVNFRVVCFTKPGALFVNPGPSVSCICHENNSYYIIDNKRELLSLHAALLRLDI